MRKIFMNKNAAVFAALLLWAFAVIFAVYYSLTVAAMASDKKIPIYCVERPDNKLSLTFNCAWDDSTLDGVLNILNENDIKCTFFIVGDFAERYPDAVRKIYNAGHEIGNHSFNHTDPVTQEYGEIVTDINSCNELLSSITGSKINLYRAPSGSYDNRTVEAAESLGMKVIQWSADSIDWKNITADKIVARMKTKLNAGGIALFHIGKENTLEALPEVIKFIKEENFEAVKVSELIYDSGYYIDNNGRQISDNKAKAFD